MIKLFFTLMLALLATSHVAAVSVCKESELGSLLTNPNTTACASDSGVVFLDLNGAPSDEQLTSICKTDACLSLMAAILAIDPADCTLPRNENLNLMSELVDPVVEKCTSMGIDIVGSGVDVGDEDSAASASGSDVSGSSSASTTPPAITTDVVVIALAAMVAMMQ